MGEYMGEYYIVVKVDTRSLDYISSEKPSWPGSWRRFQPMGYNVRCAELCRDSKSSLAGKKPLPLELSLCCSTPIALLLLQVLTHLHSMSPQPYEST